MAKFLEAVKKYITDPCATWRLWRLSQDVDWDIDILHGVRPDNLPFILVADFRGFPNNTAVIAYQDFVYKYAEQIRSAC